MYSSGPLCDVTIERAVRLVSGSLALELLSERQTVRERLEILGVPLLLREVELIGRSAEHCLADLASGDGHDQLNGQLHHGWRGRPEHPRQRNPRAALTLVYSL